MTCDTERVLGSQLAHIWDAYIFFSFFACIINVNHVSAEHHMLFTLEITCKQKHTHTHIVVRLGCCHNIKYTIDSTIPRLYKNAQLFSLLFFFAPAFVLQIEFRHFQWHQITKPENDWKLGQNPCRVSQQHMSNIQYGLLNGNKWKNNMATELNVKSRFKHLKKISRKMFVNRMMAQPQCNGL